MNAFNVNVLLFQNNLFFPLFTFNPAHFVNVGIKHKKMVVMSESYGKIDYI